MSRNRVALIAFLGLITVASPALAQESVEDVRVKAGSFELSANMGGLFFLSDNDNLKDTFGYAFNVTANFSSMFGVQLAFDFSPREVNQVSFYQIHADLIFHPLEHAWFVPFLGVGPSFVLTDPKVGERDSDPGINVLAGIDLYPWENVGFRFSARYLARLGSGEANDLTAHDLLASFGLVIAFGGEKDTGPVLLDTDGDGILDQDDSCVTVPGVPSAAGCPDADGDTIADSKDQCPNEAGPVELGGCPDSDGDKIIDKEDRCKDKPGLKKHKGCPDGDSDDIVDLDDRCPKIPGEKQYKGCPPPPPQTVIEKFTGAIEGINFDLGKATIKAESFPILDGAFAVLDKYKQIEILIEGHTSSEGGRKGNLELSRRRAESVKKYLVTKGIDAKRLSTQGFGPDRPMAENTTEVGRRQNRRIEFKLLRQ